MRNMRQTACELSVLKFMYSRSELSVAFRNLKASQGGTKTQEHPLKLMI